MEKKSKKLEQDKTIGYCPFLDALCRTDCAFYREGRGQQNMIFTYCVLARASDKIIEKADY